MVVSTSHNTKLEITLHVYKQCHNYLSLSNLWAIKGNINSGIFADSSFCSRQERNNDRKHERRSACVTLTYVNFLYLLSLLEIAKSVEKSEPQRGENQTNSRTYKATFFSEDNKKKTPY